MILNEKQIEEIERWCNKNPRQGSFEPDLLETVKDIQQKEQKARELLGRALPHVKHDLESWDAELIDQIEEHLK